MERNVKQKSVCCRKDSETVSVDISSYGCERVSSLRYRCGRKTVLPSEETRWVWVFRAVVVDEDAIRKMGDGRRRLARVGDEVGRYA